VRIRRARMWRSPDSGPAPPTEPPTRKGCDAQALETRKSDPARGAGGEVQEQARGRRPARGYAVERAHLLLLPDVRHALRVRAAMEDRDMSDLVNDALRAYLGLPAKGGKR